MKTIFPLFLLLTLSHPVLAQEYQLRYRLPADERCKYRQVEETTALAQTNDGRTTEINRKTTRYFSLQVKKSDAAGITYVNTQDTAIVEETTADPRIQKQNTLVQNILTGKGVRIRQSLHGQVEETTPLVPFESQRILGPAANDAMFAQLAVILPALPDKPLSVGMRWTESQSDTLHPVKTIPQFGKGTGIRLVTNSTEYEVAGKQDVDGIPCLLIKWKGVSGLEEKIIYNTLEEFSEEQTRSSGEMLVVIATGLPKRIDAYSDKETTRALFGAQSSVVPSSINTHTVLDLISP
jgi:hypothetical protein